MFDLYDEKKFSFFRKKAKYCSEVFFFREDIRTEHFKINQK